MAANYLQTLDWHSNPDIMKNIITFYTKAQVRLWTLWLGRAQEKARLAANVFARLVVACAMLWHGQRHTL